MGCSALFGVCMTSLALCAWIARVRVWVRVLHVGGVHCDALAHRIYYRMTVSYSWFVGVYFGVFHMCTSPPVFALQGWV